MNEKIKDAIKDIKDNIHAKEVELAKLKSELFEYENILDNLNKSDAAKIDSKKFLNDEEYEVLSSLVRVLDTSKCLVAPQVSMSSFLKSKVDDWYLYNKFYVDFLVYEKKNRNPLFVLEYFGGGHFGTNKLRVQMRDEVKKKILQSANIPLVIIHEKGDIAKIVTGNLKNLATFIKQ
ncbi:DUF2726 domain-containing protein [Helicobacter sp. WB40]|uniref:DUF2726 domain-containing protein n=1 Tax=Helicobacter sp. WB40 TaxID=3004130 RepID=UPI0022EC158B|nr:DUF2726 domain-containing protein [Helicobacter sp. WB40]MDA3967406.1 DUF2726 domain-containing protein [Helicobacter sp. WB40]